MATDYKRATGDTLVGGKPFSEVYPLTRDYGPRHAWFVERHPIALEGRRYVPYGLPVVEGIDRVVGVGQHRGVSVFARKNAGHPPDTIYVPERTGCEFRRYVPEEDTFQPGAAAPVASAAEQSDAADARPAT